MRALLVVNPVATTTSRRTREVLAAALEADLKLDVAPTTTRGHAVALGRQAAEDAVDLVVVLGGDGTVNEVVNGLLAAGPAPDGPALAVVPGGGTNVFARALGVPADPVEATGALLDALRARRTRSIGLGRAGDRWFTFTAGMGWDAAVVARVDRIRRARHREDPPGPAAYVRAAAHEFFLSGRRRHPPITVHRPGREPLTAVHLAVAANTSPWTYLGDRPLRLLPDAGFDTGLDLYALTRSGTFGTLAEARRVLTGRTAGARGRHVHREHDLADLRFSAVTPQPTQVDGEHLGSRSALTLTAAPKALRVVV